MTRARNFPPYLRQSWLLVFALLLTLPAWGQGPAGQNAGARAVNTDQLETLRNQLITGRERLLTLLDAVDGSAAREWLESTAIERLGERAEASGIGDAERALWQRALEDERATIERLQGALDRLALAQSGDQRLLDAVERVDEVLTVLTAPVILEEERSPSEIEADIATVTARRNQSVLEAEQQRQTLARLEEQARTQTETLEQLHRQREQELRDANGQLPGAGPSDAQTAFREGVERRADARILSAQLDAQTQPLRIERLRLEVQVHEWMQLAFTEQLVRLENEYGQRSDEALRALSADVQRLIEREPEVQQRFAAEIALLRQRIDEIARIQGRIRALQLDRDEYARVDQELIETLSTVRERLEIGGLTEAMGGLFLEEQRRLRGMQEKRYSLRELERELTQSRLRHIGLREQNNALRTPVAISDDAARSEVARLQQLVLTTQLQAEQALTEQLRQVEARLRILVERIDELDQILRETFLWWPSHAPAALDWFVRVPPALLALLDPRAWQEIATALINVSIGRPVESAFTLLVVLGLFVGGRNTRRQLSLLAARTKHRFTDSIGLTFKAIGWSLLRALPVPVLLMVTALRLESTPELGAAVEILAAMMFSAAIWWLAGHLLLLFTGQHGVGRAHLSWNPVVVKRLRRHLTWFLPTQLLLILLLALTFGHPNDLVFEVFGRAGLVAANLLTGILVWRLLAPVPGLEQKTNYERRRRFFRILSVFIAFGMVGLTVAGYLLTVSELLARLVDTAVVVGLVWLGHRLALRALLLNESRLLLRRMREQRAKSAAVESNSAVAEGMVEASEPHLSIEDVSVQTRSLLKVAAGASMVVALLWVWAEILPALTWLDGVTLWSRTIAVGETEILTAVSMQDGLLAVFLGVMFTLASRNLPGLVEILLSRSTAMDAAARYTITTLLRYLLAVIAVITVFSLLGLRWSELQWMVAALTLGLGFGLQEVVANFVSGIIMLFERPVRVGDTITIGEYSGTVTRIRTRATTIVDWDNREVVVPNKTFITERLINWTLSDTITRLSIPVGVSYSADVDLVMQKLREVAAEHSCVMKEPAPNVLFLKFGDSALSFELRVYVSQLRDRMTTLSELHQRIIQSFRENDIEIAYPQMDLHIRDVPPGAAAASARRTLGGSAA